MGLGDGSRGDPEGGRRRERKRIFVVVLFFYNNLNKHRMERVGYLTLLAVKSTYCFCRRPEFSS